MSWWPSSRTGLTPYQAEQARCDEINRRAEKFKNVDFNAVTEAVKTKNGSLVDVNYSLIEKPVFPWLQCIICFFRSLLGFSAPADTNVQHVFTHLHDDVKEAIKGFDTSKGMKQIGYGHALGGVKGSLTYLDTEPELVCLEEGKIELYPIKRLPKLSSGEQSRLVAVCQELVKTGCKFSFPQRCNR